jgi:hypothetical protein
MSKREVSVTEWFLLIQNSRDDEETIRHLLANLDGYTGASPARSDLIQMVNFLCAIRMHHLKSI